MTLMQVFHLHAGRFGAMQRGPERCRNVMNVLSLIQTRQHRAERLATARKTVARGPEASDYTSAHLSPTLLKTQSLDPFSVASMRENWG